MFLNPDTPPTFPASGINLGALLHILFLKNIHCDLDPFVTPLLTGMFILQAQANQSLFSVCLKKDFALLNKTKIAQMEVGVMRKNLDLKSGGSVWRLVSVRYTR